MSGVSFKILINKNAWKIKQEFLLWLAEDNAKAAWWPVHGGEVRSLRNIYCTGKTTLTRDPLGKIISPYYGSAAIVFNSSSARTTRLTIIVFGVAARACEANKF